MGHDEVPPLLIVFAGLPGSGKTTLARLLAAELGATFLRIDTIEAAVASTVGPHPGSPVGYVAAQWVAEDQLVAGHPVVIDACNNLVVARRTWTELAERLTVRLHWVEVVCSDPVEHRRRIERRRADRPGLRDPTWADVQERQWEALDEPRLLVDNVGSPAERVAVIREYVG